MTTGAVPFEGAAPVSRTSFQLLTMTLLLLTTLLTTDTVHLLSDVERTPEVARVSRLPAAAGSEPRFASAPGAGGTFADIRASSVRIVV